MSLVDLMVMLFLFVFVALLFYFAFVKNKEDSCHNCPYHKSCDSIKFFFSKKKDNK